MEEILALLNEIETEKGFPYFRQGSLSDEDYPDSFFTFWNFDTPNDKFYDNSERRFHELVQIGFYTNDASLIYSEMESFREKAKAKGFHATRATDAPSGKVNYLGRVCVITKTNELKQGG